MKLIKNVHLANGTPSQASDILTHEGTLIMGL